jgi:solute carrier family 45, member 1/2/4
MEEGQASPSSSETITGRTYTPREREREPLLQPSLTDDGDGESPIEESQPVAGGTVLGIHNLAIVFPQFIVRDNNLYVTLVVLNTCFVS